MSQETPQRTADDSDRTTLQIRLGAGDELRELTAERIAAAERGEEFDEWDEPVLNFETPADIARFVTEVNLELLQTIVQENPESINAAADLVERDYKEVHRNLTELSELGLIEFQQDGRGKRPIANYDAIEIEINLDGRDPSF